MCVVVCVYVYPTYTLLLQELRQNWASYYFHVFNTKNCFFYSNSTLVLSVL